MKIPLMLNIDGPAIVIGGGKVGQHKVSQLSKFDADIVLIDRAEIDAPGNVKLLKAELKNDNIGNLIPEDAALVISALENHELNAMVAAHCQSRGILVNVVDDPGLSTVFFTAFSKRGDVVVSVTTTGHCPFLARKIREELDGSIEEWAGWLEVLSPIRCDIDGIENKNRILSEIYEKDNIRELVRSGNIEEARKLAREISDVHS